VDQQHHPGRQGRTLRPVVHDEQVASAGRQHVGDGVRCRRAGDTFPSVAYLLVLVLTLMAVLIVLFVAMPVAIRWENVVRRRASARKRRPTG
jgi:hypothetical protein